MANIVNRMINGVSVTYDTELKNQLSTKAIARDTIKSLGREGVYKLAGTTDTAVIVKLDDETINKLGAPLKIQDADAGIDLTKFSDNMYLCVHATASWDQLGETVEVYFDAEKKSKIILDVIDLAAASTEA